MDKFSFYSEHIEKPLITFMNDATENSYKRNWLADRVDDPMIICALDNLTMLSLHILQAVSVCQPIKAIDISRRLGVTRGSISKVAQKLLDYQLINKFKKADNRKEVYYCLTQRGKTLNEKHEELLFLMNQQVREKLTHYTEDELRIICRFFTDMKAIHHFK